MEIYNAWLTRTSKPSCGQLVCSAGPRTSIQRVRVCWFLYLVSDWSALPAHRTRCHAGGGLGRGRCICGPPKPPNVIRRGCTWPLRSLLAGVQVSRNSLGNPTPRRKTRFRKFPWKFDPSDEKSRPLSSAGALRSQDSPHDDLLASPMHRRDPPKASKNTFREHFLDKGAAHTKNPTALTGS